MTPIQQELQNGTGGLIKLMGMKISFPKIWGELKKIKMSENLRNFENFIEEKNQLCTQTSENLEKSPNAQRCILSVSFPVD